MKFEFQNQTREFPVPLAVIKVGSMVLTRDDKLDREFMRGLAELIVAWRERGRKVILVSSGAIAAGIQEMRLTERPKTIPEKQALAAIGQNYLMSAYNESCGALGLKTAQILLTQGDMDDRQRYLNARLTIERLLAMGVLPIINENDTVTIDELRFGDNDKLSARVAIKTNAALLLILTNVEGLYDGPPGKPGARLLPVVEKITPEIYAHCDNKKSFLGLGGMVSKVEAAEMAARCGIYTVIANGKNAENLKAFAEDRVRGTIFLPAGRRISGRDSWIAAGKANRNCRIIVDAGAAAALRGKNKSLLAAGIRGAQGEFSFGDVVDVCDEQGELIGRGLTNYGSAEVEQIKGLRSADIARALGSKPYDEVIHRDNLVLL